MPSEIAIPFRLAADGSIAVETDPDRQITQHVESLLSTNPGERVVLRTYGVPLISQTFEPANTSMQNYIQTTVTTALATWEPGAYLSNVSVTPSDLADGQVALAVEFTRTDSATSNPALAKNINTAVVAVGGHVTETVRG